MERATIIARIVKGSSAEKTCEKIVAGSATGIIDPAG